MTENQYLYKKRFILLKIKITVHTAIWKIHNAGVRYKKFIVKKKYLLYIYMYVFTKKRQSRIYYYLPVIWENL